MCGTSATGEFRYMDCLTLTPGGESVANRFPDVGTIVNTLVQPIVVIAGLIFFFTLVFNGVKMAFNSGDQQVFENAKKYVSTSLKGLIIVFCAFWVVQIIAFLTGVNAPL